MTYRLPPIDDETFTTATAAYRAAAEHYQRVQLKWRPREKELRAADEFSRLRCAWENETHVAEKMLEWAGDVLKAAARGMAQPYSETVYMEKFDVYALKDAKKVLALIRNAVLMTEAA